MREISASAALVLAAEFDRMKRLTGFQPFPILLDEWSPNVIKVLYDLGFMSLLGIDDRDIQSLGGLAASPDYRILRFVSGQRGTHGEKIDEIKAPLKKLFSGLSDEQWLHVYDVLVEAMNNANEHAYPRKPQTPIRHVRRWWMTGAVDQDKDWLKIVFFDQGVSIPVHLPSSGLWSEVRGLLKDLSLIDERAAKSDSRRIAAAMQASTTSTGVEGRGLGLSQMLDFVKESQEGRFRILSRYGEYLYCTGQEPILTDRSYSIGGTLIEWEVRNPHVNHQVS